MEAKELMIGDWVHNETHLFGILHFSEDIKVMNVYDGLINYVVEELGLITGYELNECHPIPLTPEILEKNGFVFDNCFWVIENPKYNAKTLITYYSVDDDVANAFLGHWAFDENFAIDYVHELQHALRLCGLNELADNFKV